MKWLCWSHRWAGLGAGGGRPPVLVSFCLLSSPDQWEKVLLGNEAVLDSGIWRPSYPRPWPPAAALWVWGCGWGPPVPVLPLIPCSCSLTQGKGLVIFEWAPGFQPGNMKWLSQGLAMGYASRTRAASGRGWPRLVREQSGHGGSGPEEGFR